MLITNYVSLATPEALLRIPSGTGGIITNSAKR